MLLCRTVRFESIASTIMPMFIGCQNKVVSGCQKKAAMLATASMIMRSALSANPTDSIFIPAASALARL